MSATCQREGHSETSAHPGWVRRTARAGVAAILLLAMNACIQSPVPQQGGTVGEQLARLEAQYADTRDLYFEIYVTEARGVAQTPRGVALSEMRRAHQALRERLTEALGALDVERLGGDDRVAVTTMLQQLRGSTSIEAAGAADSASESPSSSSGCGDDVTVAATGDSAFAQLSSAIYACYGAAARRVVTSTDTADRLTVLGRLGREPSSEARRALFLSLQPIWRSVTGDGSPRSPYRTMLPLSAEQWRTKGSPVSVAARSLGLDPASVDSTLVRILRAWRDHTPATMLEPWDWYYENGAASRLLSPRINRAALREINDRFYKDQGADPTTLGVHYDLDPREGKTPVAFTQFGKAARERRGHYGESEAWVFATYREGGFDNLEELLHETGHAIHISAIATRPAFADWPDSDPFTEALGDLLALEAYEPEWQTRYLGAAAPVAASLRAKYSSIALDVAWALLELRLHDDPTRDPNAVWAEITSDYLHIRPHPEWGWWAMRGQLIDAPGYMMNYAIGAMVTAELRARIRAQRGPFYRPDAKMYGWLSDRLYRFGHSRPAREVLRDFLGKPLSEEALVTDMRRLLSPP
ncbi:MAG: hypothetical protein ABI910_15075 [Gemmatimonadota bacterium]